MKLTNDQIAKIVYEADRLYRSMANLPQVIPWGHATPEEQKATIKVVDYVMAHPLDGAEGVQAKMLVGIVCAFMAQESPAAPIDSDVHVTISVSFAEATKDAVFDLSVYPDRNLVGASISQGLGSSAGQSYDTGQQINTAYQDYAANQLNNPSDFPTQATVENFNGEGHAEDVKGDQPAQADGDGSSSAGSERQRPLEKAVVKAAKKV